MIKEKSEAINREKNQFLAKMSHELRTPMNAVIGMTDLVLMTELTEMQRVNLEFVKSGGYRLLAIINDLLDISKIEDGKMDLSQITFGICDVIQDKVISTKALIGVKPIIFNSVIGPDIPGVLVGDPLRLHQILSNLLGNAIKFTDSGNITLEVKMVKKTEDSVTLKFSIVDTGIGISADKMDRLFLYFSQIDSSLCQKYGGAGLGLFIAKELVNKMGGDIGVESELGKGSNFHFTVNLKLP